MKKAVCLSSWTGTKLNSLNDLGVVCFFPFATVSPLPACHSTLPDLPCFHQLCSTRGDWMTALKFLSQICCVSWLSSLQLWILGLRSWLIPWFLLAENCGEVVTPMWCEFLHMFMVPSLETLVPDRLGWLCYPLAHQNVCGLLLTQEWRRHC